MKTSKIIVAALCSVMAFSACNKQTTDKFVSPEDWVYDETKGAPIQILGKSVSLETKAGAIDPTVDGTLPEGVEFGVFGIGVKHNPEAEGDIDKEIIFEGLNGSGSNAMNSFVEFDVATGVHLANLTYDGKPVYYPVRSVTDYTFYGFHVGEGADNTILSYEDGKYVKDIEDYGQTDVLWAKAVATPYSGLTGFNAKYIRTIKDAEAHGDVIKNAFLPTFNFSHQTTCFEFRVKAKTKKAEKSFEEENANVRVTSARVENLKSTAKLVVVGDGEGEIVENEYPKMTKDLDCEGGVYPTLDEVTELGTLIGKGIFVKPESIEDITFVAVLEQRPVENGEIYRTITIPGTQIKEEFDVVNFEKGNRYTVQIVVDEAMKVEIQVKLQPWVDGGSKDIETIE